MSAGCDVIVVGDVMTDVVARLASGIALGSDAAASIRMTGGGSAANVAAWLAHDGAAVALVGRLGRDDAGAARAAELRALGVQTHLAVGDTAPTGTVVVLATPDGERTMFPDRGANLALRPADIPADLFASGRHLHVSGYVLLDAATRDAGTHAMQLARDAGMTISVDASSAHPLISVGAERFLQWAAAAGTCLANLPEAVALTGVDADEEAARQLASRCGEAVVKLGGRGALWSDGGRTVHVDAAPADVVDTTGAGDAFAAGYLHARLGGDNPRAALHRGTALAALAVARTGARPPAP